MGSPRPHHVLRRSLAGCVTHIIHPLRAVWTLKPQLFDPDAPLGKSDFQPSRTIPHNCQTGRWLTILRAQWSLNMDYIPFFTVGNMKRSLDVVACTGDKIVSLWTDG